MPKKNEVSVHPSPVKLNINNNIIQYRVAGIIAHNGTLESGHYSYFLKDKSGWLEISDLAMSKKAPPGNGYLVLLELELNLG